MSILFLEHNLTKFLKSNQIIVFIILSIALSASKKFQIFSHIFIEFGLCLANHGEKPGNFLWSEKTNFLQMISWYLIFCFIARKYATLNCFPSFVFFSLQMATSTQVFEWKSLKIPYINECTFTEIFLASKSNNQYSETTFYYQEVVGKKKHLPRF